MIHQHLIFVSPPTSRFHLITWPIILCSAYIDSIEQQKQTITSRSNGSWISECPSLHCGIDILESVLWTIIATCIRSPVLDEESMKPGRHWLRSMLGVSFSALTPTVGWQQGHPSSKNLYHLKCSVTEVEEENWEGPANPDSSRKLLLLLLVLLLLLLLPFYGPWTVSGTTRVSRYQKGKTGDVKPICIYWSKR